jgi:PPOX class probable F420-dependent enzyme
MVTIDEVQRFLVENHNAVLVARKRNGSPQITLVTAGVDGVGRVVISARKNTFKVKNISRDPQVSLLVMGEEIHGSNYYQIDGRAEIIALPESMDLLLDAYRRRLGDEMDLEDTRRKIVDQDRVIIRIEIDAVGPQSRG